MKPCLQDFSFEELSFITEWGFPRFRVEQVYNAAIQYKSYDNISNLPKALIEKLKENFADRGLEIIKTLSSKDGTEKYLYRLNDGNIIEGVFMPHGYGDTLCVSTQVGCRMGCEFCASGLGGLVRNLTAGEILSQVLCVNALKGGTAAKRAITNIVLMGSGEPLDNFDNTVKFLRLISDERGINISLRNISLSTCGLVPRIIELADMDLPVTLTISLHAPSDKKRTALMPINKAHNLFSVIEAAKYYFEKTKRRIIFEYSFVEGENSDTDSAKQLAALVKGLPCHINLINLNFVEEKGLRGVSAAQIKEFMRILDENNVSNTLRRSMGNDIEGACGQLRNKFAENKNG
ncbi:MAG: 23S rRNA (adenine(2503)-C(2))-methyltransferase RlmN [Clostridia bacterium]|nr:23S rRNA (adenine(2503)-C(2))-methyltransferase RlmN [Clostridia bacterium]